MATAQELLGIRIRARDLREKAEKMVKDYTQRKVSQAQKSLKEIARDRSTYSQESREHIGDAYRLFIKHYPEGRAALRNAFDTSRKTRRLAWALCYRGKEQGVTIVHSRSHLQTALDLIGHRWRWHSLFGVFDALLKSWNDDSARHTLQQFLSRKLHEYEGRRPRLVRLQEDRGAFLRSDGPTHVATSFLQGGRPITEIWETLPLPDHTLGYPYVAELASAYTRTAMRSTSYREHIRPILRFLSEHDRGVTYKRCLSRIILRLEKDEPVDERENVLQIAFRKIGDPARAPEWQPWSGASEAEREELHSARQTLNNWIAQRFITTFFDKVAMDEDRRAFWLRYAPHVTRFKVYGDDEAKHKLRKDQRIRKYVDRRFGKISGSMNAILMQIKDRFVVEFGRKGGACYIHRKGSPSCPSFDASQIHIRDLRIGTSFPLLMRRSKGNFYDVRGEGRFIHNPPDAWQRDLDWWMRQKLGVEV
jgi:hypothetical protein